MSEWRDSGAGRGQCAGVTLSRLSRGPAHTVALRYRLLTIDDLQIPGYKERDVTAGTRPHNSLSLAPRRRDALPAQLCFAARTPARPSRDTPAQPPSLCHAVTAVPAARPTAHPARLARHRLCHGCRGVVSRVQAAGRAGVRAEPQLSLPAARDTLTRLHSPCFSTLFFGG